MSANLIHPELPISELDLDSISIVLVLYDLEDELGVRIPFETQPQGLETVGDLYQLVIQTATSIIGNPQGK